ncbi:MAG: NUDIX hydrolase [Acidiferrobacteraceae bacterium]
MTDRRVVRWRGRVVEVATEEAVLPDGRRAEFDVVRHPGGAAVVALNDQGEVCLLRQFRHVAREWLWELPAGRRDSGEEPLATARRELAEEAGLSASSWVPLGRVFSSPGVFTEVVHLFQAEHLTHEPVKREAEEYMELHWVKLGDALEWASDGRIYDAKTVIGLFRARPGSQDSGGAR